MKAAVSSFLLLFLSVSVFGHGVERGKVWNGIAGSDLSLLSEATKNEISDTLAARCNLANAVSATAEFTANDEPLAAMGKRSVRIRILVQMENRPLPETIIVIATQKPFAGSDGDFTMEYAITSPLCR